MSVDGVEGPGERPAGLFAFGPTATTSRSRPFTSTDSPEGANSSVAIQPLRLEVPRPGVLGQSTEALHDGAPATAQALCARLLSLTCLTYLLD
jgi:hypothetical protein